MGLPVADTERSLLLSADFTDTAANSTAYAGSTIRVYGSTGSTEEDVPVETQVYKRRWWILLVFCLNSCTQGLLWNTWSPIADAAQIAFNLNNSFSAILLAVSDTMCVIATIPFMFAVEKSGLRHGIVVSSAMLVFCCTIWNIALPLNQFWLVGVGSSLNGVTSAFSLAAPSLLSVTWFPISERTTATSFATLSITLGTGVAYLSGPYISGSNVTSMQVDDHSKVSAEFKAELEDGIHNVVYFGTAFAAACFITATVYFPLKPPKPPSKSQTKKRKDFLQGSKQLLRNSHFWLLNISFNLSNGLFNAWLPLCSVNFRSLGIDEVTSGWIGFTAIIVSCVSSVAMSVVVDRFKRKMKLFLQLADICAFVTYAVLACIQENYIQLSQQYATVLVYVLCGVTALCINGVMPLYYELACECAFPVHEGLTCSLLGMMNSGFAVVYFLLFLNPTLATETGWMTWTCVGACALTVPLLSLVKESFSRLDLDTGVDQ